MPNTFKFADGRIKLFSFIMRNLGTHTCFQYGDSGIRISIEGHTVHFLNECWKPARSIHFN